MNMQWSFSSSYCRFFGDVTDAVVLAALRRPIRDRTWPETDLLPENGVLNCRSLSLDWHHSLIADADLYVTTCLIIGGK